MSTSKNNNKFLIFAAAVSSLGGMIYGYDLVGIAGAILFIKKEFDLSPWMQELVMSSTLFGAMIGAGFGGRLADRLGRRRVLMVSALISFFGVLGTVLSPDILWLIISRIVVGAAFGLASFAVPLYISEISSPKKPWDAGFHICCSHSFRCADLLRRGLSLLSLRAVASYVCCWTYSCFFIVYRYVFPP